MLYGSSVLFKKIFGLPLSEVEFGTRGFYPDANSSTKEKLELSAKSVVQGYNIALQEGYSLALINQISMIENELQGFFCEGVGMGLFVKDRFSIRNTSHFDKFLQKEGRLHSYMAYIGAGLAIGVFKLPYENFLATLNPFYSNLVFDGIGFQHAYFKTAKYVNEQRYPEKAINDAVMRERYFAGVGRALWFISGGNDTEAVRLVTLYPEKVRAHIWSGLGLACTYAGGVDATTLSALKLASGKYRKEFITGCLIAVHTRVRAKNLADHNSLAAHVIADKEVAHISAVSTQTKQDLDGRALLDSHPTWGIWMTRLQDELIECEV